MRIQLSDFERETVKRLHKKYSRIRRARSRRKRAFDPYAHKSLYRFDGWKSWKAFTREK